MSPDDIAQIILMGLVMYIGAQIGGRHAVKRTLEALSKHGLEIHARNATVRFTESADDASG